jgi:hypothetical protein
MKVVSRYQYQFTEEEQRALVLVDQVLYKIWETVYNDTEERERYFDAYCVIDGLCEDIPSHIWNPDEDEERKEQE